jgi:hypothetical protein
MTVIVKSNKKRRTIKLIDDLFMTLYKNFKVKKISIYLLIEELKKVLKI